MAQRKMSSVGKGTEGMRGGTKWGLAREGEKLQGLVLTAVALH